MRLLPQEQFTFVMSEADAFVIRQILGRISEHDLKKKFNMSKRAYRIMSNIYDSLPHVYVDLENEDEEK